MKIYVLTDGDYSDYHIIGVFDNEEQGNKAVKLFGGGLEEWELNAIGKDNRYKFSVGFLSNSEIRVVPESDDQAELNKVRAYGSYGQPRDNYQVYVMAEDKEHAVKIASDLVAQYKALAKPNESPS